MFHKINFQRISLSQTATKSIKITRRARRIKPRFAAFFLLIFWKLKFSLGRARWSPGKKVVFDTKRLSCLPDSSSLIHCEYERRPLCVALSRRANLMAMVHKVATPHILFKYGTLSFGRSASVVAIMALDQICPNFIFVRSANSVVLSVEFFPFQHNDHPSTSHCLRIRKKLLLYASRMGLR